MLQGVTIPTRKARKNRKCVLENLDFWWDEPELKELRQMWEEGMTLETMAIHFGRKDSDEVFLALFHLAREDKITARESGLRGK
jgi:hypothetical protein